MPQEEVNFDKIVGFNKTTASVISASYLANPDSTKLNQRIASHKIQIAPKDSAVTVINYKHRYLVKTTANSGQNT